MVLGYLERNLDACGAKRKICYISDNGPQEAIFFGDRQDVTYDLVHALCPERNAI